MSTDNSREAWAEFISAVQSDEYSYASQHAHYLPSTSDALIRALFDRVRALELKASK